jgi:hypothetical protein
MRRRRGGGGRIREEKGKAGRKRNERCSPFGINMVTACFRTPFLWLVTYRKLGDKNGQRPGEAKKKLLEWSQIDVCAYLHNFF